MTHHAGRVIWCLLAMLCWPVRVAGQDAEPLPAAEVEYFEEHIRPVLVAHCYECHGESDAPDGGLRVDSRAGLRLGGDSGPALVPGKPAESRLLSAMRYANPDLQMPPDGPLSEATVARFEQWIARGAVDPRSGQADMRPNTALDLESARQFWAYQLPRPSPLPAVRRSAWPINAIDHYVLAQLEAAGLAPADDASREVLVRRLYFDLLGLAPTPEELDIALADTSPDAYERLVDRLLASPRFGERWGRHWLDVARFGESLTLRGFLLPEAWRYRDYVIDAFNHDRSYQQMVREQIAGDLLDATDLLERQRQVIATTYLALGNTNLEEQDKQQLEMDYVDEQLDTIGRGLLAQTIGCARCHDHKFDPIPTRDYYALAGILHGAQALEHANVSKWIEVPLPLAPADEARLSSHEAQIAALEQQLKSKREQLAQLEQNGPAIVSPSYFRGIVVDDAAARRVGDWQDSQYSGRYIGDGYLHDNAAGQGEKTLTFLPELPATGEYEVRLAYSPGTNRASNVLVTIFSAEGETELRIDERQTPPVDGRFVVLGRFRFEPQGQSFVIVANEGADGHVIADAVQFLPLDDVASAAQPPANGDELDEARRALQQQESHLKELRARGPVRPRVLSVREKESAAEMRIHIRGSVHNLGEVVPRGFLTVANYDPQTANPDGAIGRRELAEWLASARNPLTARVFTNRVWHWLMGAGLVRTPDNFGTTGTLPTHPELLDALTLEFTANDWSPKHLVRSVVLSRTYQLSSVAPGPLVAADPENRLWGRAMRKRLDAEALRDAVLQLGGTLNLEMGGPTIRPGTESDYGYVATEPRRSVYLPVLRNAVPDVFEAFDFADPSVTTGRRSQTTAVPQALLIMNHPFFHEQSRIAAERLLRESRNSDEQRLKDLFRQALGRYPTDAEAGLARDYLAGWASDPEAGWTGVVHALIASVDFRYLD